MTVLISYYHFFNKIEKSDKKGISETAQGAYPTKQKINSESNQNLPIPNGLFVKESNVLRMYGERYGASFEVPKERVL